MLFHIGILGALLINNFVCSNPSEMLGVEIDAFDDEDDYSEIEEDLQILEIEDEYRLLRK